MLREGRIQMNTAEHEAVDRLIGKDPGRAVSVTRQDPGETGQLLVHVGDSTYEVDEAGRARRTGPTD